MAALLTLISICAVSENTALSVAFRIKDGNKLTTALHKSTILEIRVGHTNPNPDASGSIAQYAIPAKVKATLPGCPGETQCCVTMAASDMASLTYPSSIEQLTELFGNPDTDLFNGVRSVNIAESAPLYLRKPTWRVKQISHDVSHPLATNTIYLNVGTNVPLTVGTLVNVRGFISKNCDLKLAGTRDPVFQHQMMLGLDAGRWR